MSRRAKLQQAVFDGEQAEAILREMDGFFVEMREECRSTLIHSVRTKAGDAEVLAGAYELTALENTYEKLYQKVRTGRKAQQAIEKEVSNE